MRLPIDQIDVPSDRLRKIDARAVQAIAEDLKPDGTGLINPILVWKKGGRWQLIAGEHRLSAAVLVKWSDIPAIHWDWQLNNPEADDEEVELRARFIEAAENMKRKDLTAADVTYADMQLKRAADRLAEKAQEKVWRDRRAQAEAAVRNAKTSEEKKTAEADLKKVKEAERKREARGAAARANGSQFRPKRSVAGANTNKAVAAASGRSEANIRKSVERSNAVAGREAEFRGTSLSSTEEMLAYGELRKLAPDIADDTFRNAVKGYKVSAVAALTALKTEIRAAEEAEKTRKAKADPDEALLILDGECASVRGEVNRLIGRVKELNLKARVPQFERILTALDEVHEMAVQVRRTRRVEKGGKRYEGTKPEDIERRKQAKADQEANSKIPLEVLKKVVR